MDVFGANAQPWIYITVSRSLVSGSRTREPLLGVGETAAQPLLCKALGGTVAMQRRGSRKQSLDCWWLSEPSNKEFDEYDASGRGLLPRRRSSLKLASVAGAYLDLS